jgi:5,6-dimethylbenzimidazole synthase
MPEGSKPIAILCLGPVHAFYDQPMLQAEKWARRAALADMVFEDRWGQSAGPVATPGEQPTEA